MPQGHYPTNPGAFGGHPAFGGGPPGGPQWGGGAGSWPSTPSASVTSSPSRAQRGKALLQRTATKAWQNKPRLPSPSIPSKVPGFRRRGGRGEDGGPSAAAGSSGALLGQSSQQFSSSSGVPPFAQQVQQAGSAGQQPWGSASSLAAAECEAKGSPSSLLPQGSACDSAGPVRA